MMKMDGRKIYLLIFLFYIHKIFSVFNNIIQNRINRLFEFKQLLKTTKRDYALNLMEKKYCSHRDFIIIKKKQTSTTLLWKY